MPLTSYGPSTPTIFSAAQAAHHVDLLAVAQRRHPHVLAVRRAILPGVADVVRAGGHEHAAGHALVDELLGLVHVLGLHRVVLRTTDLGRVHFLAVDRDDERLGLFLALDAGVAFFDAAHQPAVQLVEAIGGEHVAHHRAAARAERQAVDVAQLRELAADPVLGRAGRRGLVADRHRADALRDQQVALEQQRRRAQRRGDVVEAEVGAVARQQLVDVDVERQQIADGVAVLGAVQPVHDVLARRGLALPLPIERRGQPRRERRCTPLPSDAACPGAAWRARSACAARAPTSRRWRSGRRGWPTSRFTGSLAGSGFRLPWQLTQVPLQVRALRGRRGGRRLRSGGGRLGSRCHRNRLRRGAAAAGDWAGAGRPRSTGPGELPRPPRRARRSRALSSFRRPRPQPAGRLLFLLR